MAPARPPLLAAAVALGLGLATIGLVASTFHLGRPGARLACLLAVAHLLALARRRGGARGLRRCPPAGVAAARHRPDRGLAVRLVAAATAALALATIACTAMIYASLKPVRQWRHPAVPAIYLLLALATGALLLDGVRSGVPASAARSLRGLALVGLLGAWLAKERYWRDAATPTPAR